MPADELVGPSAADLVERRLIGEALVDELAAVAHGGDERRVRSCAMGGNDGRRFEPWLVSVRHGGEIRVAMYARDVTDRQQVEENLRGRVDRDPLTGLLNHAAFHDRIAEVLASCPTTDRDVGLIVVDLDYLKVLNDVHGHHVGDVAIRAVADILRTTTRGSDIVGRLGGDEFACLVVDTSPAATAEIAQRVVTNVCRHALPGVGRLSASAGVAFLASTLEPGDLFDRADRALYDAKASGRGVIAVADDTDIAYESRRVSRPDRTSSAAPDLSVASTRSAAARAALREWVNVLAASGGCVDLLDAQERSVRACTYYRFGHDDWTLAEQTYLLSDYPNTARALAERTTYT